MLTALQTEYMFEYALLPSNNTRLGESRQSMGHTLVAYNFLLSLCLFYFNVYLFPSLCVANVKRWNGMIFPVGLFVLHARRGKTFFLRASKTLRWKKCSFEISMDLIACCHWWIKEATKQCLFSWAARPKAEKQQREQTTGDQHSTFCSKFIWLAIISSFDQVKSVSWLN